MHVPNKYKVYVREASLSKLLNLATLHPNKIHFNNIGPSKLCSLRQLYNSIINMYGGPL